MVSSDQLDSGNDIGPFKAIEESMLSQLIPLKQRSNIIAWYYLIGTLGAASGTVLCGWVVQQLQDKRHWTVVESYQVVFWAYTAMGLLKFLLSIKLSATGERQESEPDKRSENAQSHDPLLAGKKADRNLYTQGSFHTSKTGSPKSPFRLSSLLPSFTSETKTVVLKLCFIFVFDNIGIGLAPASWMTYFFSRKFGLSEGFLGSLFFAIHIIAASSNLVASSITRRLGLLTTMFATNLPAAILVALIPLPSSVVPAMILLILRTSTNEMDQVPRQAFLAAVVLPEERTAVMGLINTVRTLSQGVGPIVTGYFAETGRFWIAFGLAGGLKCTYDVLLLCLFWRYETREERADRDERDRS